MTWGELLDHMITVEGECMEENYGKGRALNDADEECNAGIRRAYASLLKVKPALMAAPELLAALREAYAALDFAQAQVDSEADRMHLTRCRRKIKPIIDQAEGRTSETTPD